MEGLIIMAVIAILSRIFSNNGDKQKKQKQSPAMPPFSNGKPQATYIEPEPVERPSRPKLEVKSLDDFAKEVFGQLQEKVQKEQPKVAVDVVEPVETAPVKTARPIFMERPELGEGRTIIQKERQKQKGVQIPNTREDLVQAVIMAEVLGPPKARNSRRTV